jgi:phytanoyl-CoA hydroxylase
MQYQENDYAQTTATEKRGNEIPGQAHNTGAYDHVVASPYDDDLYAPSSYASPARVKLGEPLSSTVVDAYKRDGYIVIENLLDESIVDRAIAAIDRLLDGSIEGFRAIQWEASARDKLPRMDLAQRRDAVRKVFKYVDFQPDLRDIVYAPTILGLARDLLGDEPGLYMDQALLKPPGIGREKPWHQDKAFFDIPGSAPVVGLWIALDEAVPENGCMHIIPGSHKDGPSLHFTRRDFQICDSDIVRDRIVAVPLKPGSCLVFDGLLHHGTPANRGGKRRWALQIHYSIASALSLDPSMRAEYAKQRLDTFGSDGKDATC